MYNTVCVCLCVSVCAHSAPFGLTQKSLFPHKVVRLECHLEAHCTKQPFPTNLHLHSPLSHLLKYILLKQTNNPPPNYCLYVNNYTQDIILR